MMSRVLKSSCVAPLALAAMAATMMEGTSAAPTTTVAPTTTEALTTTVAPTTTAALTTTPRGEVFDASASGESNHTFNIDDSKYDSVKVSGHDNKVFVNVASVHMLDMSQENGNHDNYVVFKPETVATITKLQIGGNTNAVELQGDNITEDVLNKIDFQCTGDYNGVILPNKNVYDSLKHSLPSNCAVYNGKTEFDVYNKWFRKWWVWFIVGLVVLLLIALIAGVCVAAACLCGCCCFKKRSKNDLYKDDQSTVQEPVIVKSQEFPEGPVCQQQQPGQTPGYGAADY